MTSSTRPTLRTLRALQRGYAASMALPRQSPVRVHVRRRAPEPCGDLRDLLQAPPARERRSPDPRSAAVFVDLRAVAS